MKNNINFLLLVLLIIGSINLSAQVYPPQKQLVFDAMPNVAKPAYLSPITDPVYGSTVIRVTDRATFNTHHQGLDTYHHYAKTQAWNSDGTMIKLQGWPSAILDGETYQFIKTVFPPGGHHTWSNTKPNIIYGTNNPNYDGNCIAQLDVNTNTRTLIRCFNEYSFVSHGEYEGNMSNDDRYMAIQCRKPDGTMEIACYDFVTDTKVSTLSAPVWPNNVTMSQSGKYVIVQWNRAGTGPTYGVWAYNSNDMSPVRNLSSLGGSHFDYGYDTQGNEVMVGPHNSNRSIRMIRIDNGQETFLLGDNQMSWYIHISCRNLKRPGWAYLTEFANENTQTTKPNYQKIFAVQLNPNANNNALTETFAHVHHSPHVNYDRSPFGVPNRNGSKVMFRSDWMGNASSEINSYVAYMPGNPVCNLSCTATQITAPTCDGNNGQASANVSGGTAPYTYSWNDPSAQNTATASGLTAGSYTVTITDENNCNTSCTASLVYVDNGGGNASPFESVPTQSSVAWNAGNANSNRTKPALGVWESGDVPGTEIMRISDAAGNGLHFYNSRQTWNADMTKLMIGNGVLDKNRLLDATNNYAVLPTRVNLNSDRVWSNTNPDLIYGMSGPSNFYVLNVTTGVRTLLYARPGGTQIGIRTKGNLPGDDSKIALYEPSTNKIISFDIQTRSVIAEIVWPHGNVNDGGNYVSYDWTGNWVIVGLGTGSSNLYRMKPDLTNIQLVHNKVQHFDQAYNTNGESVQVQTRGNGSVQVINFDDPGKNYISPIFGGADPNQWPRYTPDYISGRGQNGAPGWVAFGGESTAGSPNHPLGLYRIDGNTSIATIKVIGFDHHSTAPAISAGGNDDRQKPSVSPDGNQIIFTSDWGVPNGALSSYIIRGIQTNTPCDMDAPIGCPTEIVTDGNISIEEPLPAGGASWLSSSPFWSCTQNGNTFDVTQYIVPPNPNAFTLNGLPAADYCCNFEGIPLDANGNQLPTIFNQCCFTVESDHIHGCNATIYVGDPLTSNYHRAGTINSDATIPQNTLVEFIVSIAVNLMNGFTIEQDGELSIGFEDCDDPITCSDSRYITHTVLNTTNQSIQLKMETAQNMPLRLIYYPTANPSAIQYQTCEYSYLYGANGNEHVQTISGLTASTEYTITIQTSTDVVSSQSDCPNMNWEDISCPFQITTNDN